MAIYLCRCPLLGIGFIEPLPHRKAKKANLVKSVRRGIADGQPVCSSR